MKLNILYEDKHIIVVVKPSGILSQEDSTKDPDMLTLIKEYIKVNEEKEGNVFLGLVHRLDRMTSGIMVFAKRSKSASRLSEQIQKNEFKKSYIALVEGKVNESGTLKNYLLKNEQEVKSYVTNEKTGKLALLDYELIKYINDNSLVKVNLHTGRHHQIRVQFANIKHPLVGDVLYGSKIKTNLKLHAYKLEFLHPITGETLTFENYPDWIK